MAHLKVFDEILTSHDSIVDVLYITLAEMDEFPYAENVDDMVFIIRTVDSDLLLGFEILDAKRHGPETVWEVLLPVIENEKRRLRGQLPELHAKLEELARMHLQELVPA